MPAVLGFHPQDSVVLLTFGPPEGAFHARVDLPVGPAEQEAVADVLLDAVLANQAERAAVLLYTDDVEAAHAQADVLLARLLEHARGGDRRDPRRRRSLAPRARGRLTRDAVRLDTHPFTAQRVFEGQVVHRDREELEDSLIGTDEEDAVEVALAATRFADLVAGSRKEAAHRFLRTEARWLQQRIRARIDDREQLDRAGRRPAAGARLARCRPATSRGRRSPVPTRQATSTSGESWCAAARGTCCPEPASLLAFAAWQHGDGALAWCAIDRCLEVDPDYSMAHYVAEVLNHAVPPTVWQQLQEDDLPVFRKVVATVTGVDHRAS